MGAPLHITLPVFGLDWYTLISDGITGIVLVRVVWVVKYILLFERETPKLGYLLHCGVT